MDREINSIDLLFALIPGRSSAASSIVNIKQLDEDGSIVLDDDKQETYSFTSVDVSEPVSLSVVLRNGDSDGYLLHRKHVMEEVIPLTGNYDLAVPKWYKLSSGNNGVELKLIIRLETVSTICTYLLCVTLIYMDYI